MPWLSRMGYMGPSSSPMNATAIAFSIREGTTHTVTWNLMVSENSQLAAEYHRWMGSGALDSNEGIEEQRPTFANLTGAIKTMA